MLTGIGKVHANSASPPLREMRYQRLSMLSLSASSRLPGKRIVSSSRYWKEDSFPKLVSLRSFPSRRSHRQERYSSFALSISVTTRQALRPSGENVIPDRNFRRQNASMDMAFMYLSPFFSVFFQYTSR